MEDDFNNNPPTGGSARSVKGKPISAKRQKILADAFSQLRKARAKMDPGVLSKIREIVKNSPAIMQKLGLTEAEGQKLKSDADMPLSSKGGNKSALQRSEPAAQKTARLTQEQYEKIDQAKNMEIMVKLMQLNPQGQSDIKAVIKKSRR